MMKCVFCGNKFDPDCAGKSCAGCLLKGKCSLVRCPVCGYETPLPPRWFQNLMNLFGKERKA